MRLSPFPALLAAICAILPTGMAAAETAPSSSAQWTPIRDAVYWQESGRQVPTDRPVFAVGMLDGVIYAGFGNGLMRLAGDALEPLPDAPAEYVLRMKTAGGALWVMTKDALHRFDRDGWTRVAEGQFADVCEYNGDVIAARDNRLYRHVDGKMDPWSAEDPTIGPISALACYADTVFCMGFDRMFLFDGVRFVSQRQEITEFGSLPSKDLRDMISMGDRLVVGTHIGLGVIRGTAASSILGFDGLPHNEITCLTRGFDRDFWAGTTKGAIRCVNGEFQYFTANRWLPDERVNAIACAGHTVCVATDKGLGIIDYEPYTLLKKADYYERHLEEWGQKRMAFTHKLDRKGDGWVREVSDNDVGWSTHYWAAQAFKHAVTGDAQARKNAVDGFNAMKWSEEISGIPGFPARSVWAVGETGHQAEGGSGHYEAEWHRTADDRWEWKGDTSSDETDAQFYYAWIFHTLVANEKEKAKVAEHVSRIMDHIIEHGWTLCDVDGKPTVWARWDPEYFAGKGAYAKGLNGMEVLTYLRVTHAITGDAKYLDAYGKLLGEGYADQVIVQKKVLAPRIFHSDDRLAFYCYYTLLQLEKDPYWRGIYRRSLERSWEIERIEQVPWFNFIYGALTGNDCETGPAVEHLRAWPLDLRHYAYDHTHRLDIQPSRGYLPYAKVERALSPRETNARRWTDNQGELKGHGHGTVTDPAGWLDAYWMGRYYGMILPPETTDPALISVPRRGLQLGAVPYDGPPMPNLMGN